MAWYQRIYFNLINITKNLIHLFYKKIWKKFNFSTLVLVIFFSIFYIYSSTYNLHVSCSGLTNKIPYDFTKIISKSRFNKFICKDNIIFYTNDISINWVDYISKRLPLAQSLQINDSVYNIIKFLPKNNIKLHYTDPFYHFFLKNSLINSFLNDALHPLDIVTQFTTKSVFRGSEFMNPLSIISEKNKQFVTNNFVIIGKEDQISTCDIRDKLTYDINKEIHNKIMNHFNYTLQLYK